MLLFLLFCFIFQSTESDLSWESDDPVINNSRVSFTEFMQQFKELTDWLSHIQLMTLRHSSSLSEKYLNQVSQNVEISGSNHRVTSRKNH